MRLRSALLFGSLASFVIAAPIACSSADLHPPPSESGDGGGGGGGEGGGTLRDTSIETGVAASIAKSYVGEMAGRLVQACVQMHGGIGVTWEHDLHLYLRRVALYRSMFGTPEEHNLRVYEAERAARSAK